MSDLIGYSTSINCRDPQGKLFAVVEHPRVPYVIGNAVQINRKQYLVIGMIMVNKRLNINFQEITNDSQ